MQRRTAPVQFTPSPKKPMRTSAFAQSQGGEGDQQEFAWDDHSLMHSALLHRHTSLLVAKRYFMGGDITTCAEFLKDRRDPHLTGQFIAQAFSALQEAKYEEVDVQERFIAPFVPLLKSNLASMSESALLFTLQALETGLSLCGFMLSAPSNISQKRRKEKWVELWKPVASTLMKTGQTMKKGDPLRSRMEALISNFRKHLK